MTLLAPDSLGCVYVDLSLLLDDRLVLSCKVVTLTFRAGSRGALGGVCQSIVSNCSV